MIIRQRVRVRATPRSGASGQPGRRPRVLHLAFEAPARSGANGGAIRTRQVNERLAGRYDITCVCARYRGARARVENGVRYRFIGLPLGYLGSLVSYLLCLPYALYRYRSDLVVEEFAAPFSTVGVPYLTRRPVIGVAEWLFAREKALQYKLPFYLVERCGLRAHRDLIAVCESQAAELRRRNPRARVHVAGCGVDVALTPTGPVARSGIRFIGRLDIAQKGLDLLLDAYAAIASRVAQDLLIAGDGRDRERLERQARRLGISDRVKFLGWIPVRERMRYLAGADFVVMPSRYETFGMVAAEALAVSTPVIASSIPSLRELVTTANGILVPDLTIENLAAAMLRLAQDPVLRHRLGSRGPQSVDQLTWDDCARQQGDVYAEVLDGDAAVRQGSSRSDADVVVARHGR